MPFARSRPIGGDGPLRGSNRPRLLHVVGDTKFGGDSVLVIALGQAAEADGFEVDILATHSVFQEKIRESGLHLVDLDVVRRRIRPAWDLAGLRRLQRYLRSEEYSIVHTHGSKPGVLGRLAARRSGVPGILHTVHGFAFHEESGRMARTVYVGAERRAAKWCDAIVTVSEFHRAWALRVGIGTPDQVIAIPNGLPLERVQQEKGSAATRAELGLSDEFVLLSTGRLAEQKGLEYLIRAMPLISELKPRPHVLLAGEGPLEAELKALVSSLGVSDRVQFLGFRDDIGDLLAAADAVVLPSLWEGLSVSLLEAMAAKRPVITTRIGSNVEVTNDGQGAHLVPPKAPRDLADAIDALATDETRRDALAGRGARIQQDRYSLGPMTASYVREYRRLLSGAAMRRT